MNENCERCLDDRNHDGPDCIDCRYAELVDELEATPNPMKYFIISINRDGSMLIKSEAEDTAELDSELNAIFKMPGFVPFYTGIINLENGTVAGLDENNSPFQPNESVTRNTYRQFDITQILSRRLK